MKSITYYKNLLTEEIDEKLSKKQMDIADEAEPFDKITGADFKALQAKKKKGDVSSKEEGYMGTQYDSSEDMAVDMLKKGIREEDHEVSMAQNSLKSIVSSASQLMNLLGDEEKDIPAWIQDHITNAENYINQASKNYHEYSEGEHDMDELPDGTIEEPVGDEEDTGMTLKSMMEDLFEAKKKKPSAGLSKKKKSAIVKQAKKGKDFGKKGPGFKAIVKKAKASGAKDPEAVAGAAFWKSQAKKGK